jgi:hypothetical protein
MTTSLGEISATLELKDRLTPQLKLAQAEISKFDKQIADFGDRARDASGKFVKMGDELGGVGKSAGSAAGLLSTAAGAFAGFLGAQVVLDGVSKAMGFLKDATFGMNSTLETSTLQFETLMGDADKAKAHVEGLFEFAKNTPFETGPIITASRMLQTFGGDALNTMATLEKLGNASAATSAPISELGTWVGRLYSSLQAGKPFGEAAQRLTELAVLSPKTRIQMEKLAESGADSAKVFKLFEDSLDSFSGAMDKQAGSWEGLTSTLSDSLQILAAGAMKPLFEATKDLVSGFNEFLGSNKFAAQAEGLAKIVTDGLGRGIAFASQAWDVFATAGKGVWDVLKLVFDAVSAVLEKLGVMDVLQNVAANFVNGLAMSLQAVGKGLSWVAGKIREMLQYVGLLDDEAGQRTPGALYKTDVALTAVSKSADSASASLTGAARGSKETKDAVQQLADTMTGKDVSKKLQDMALALDRAEKQGGLTAAATMDLGKQIDDLVGKGGKLPPKLRDIWTNFQSAELRALALAGGTDILSGKIEKLTKATLGAPPAWATFAGELRNAAKDLGDLDKQLGGMPGKISALGEPPPLGAWHDWRERAGGVLDDLERNVADHFMKLVGHASDWKKTFGAIWDDIKGAISNVLGDILYEFENRFIKGMLASITGAKGGFNGAFSDLFSGWGGGAAGAGGAGSTGSAAAAGGASGAAWASAFGSALLASGLLVGIGAIIRSIIGFGESPERDPRIIGRRDDDGDGVYETPVYAPGIEQDEYDRRYPTMPDPGNPVQPDPGAFYVPDPYDNNPGHWYPGYVPPKQGGTPFNLGDGGEGEYIIPASLMRSMRGGGPVVNVYVAPQVPDVETFRGWLRNGAEREIAESMLRILPGALAVVR